MTPASGHVSVPPSKVKYPGHSIQYSPAVAGNIKVGEPDYTIKVENEEFRLCRAILENASNLVKASGAFRDKDVLELKDRKAYQVKNVLEWCLSGKAIKDEDMDKDRAIRYFDLAHYLQMGSAENLLAQKYIRACLKEHAPLDPQKLVLMKEYLKSLDLSNLAEIDEKTLAMMKDWNIESLNLRHTTLSQSAFAALGQLKTLRVLDVSYSPLLGDKAISYLSGLSQLTSLDISSAGGLVDPASIEKLTALTQLHVLKLNHEKTSGMKNVAALAKLPLTELELAGTDVGIEELKGFTQLERLDYSGHGKVNKDKVKGVLPTLKTLIV